ncbi:MAG: hypothetical protein HUU02_14840 [Bacteroidetes bacterium]|nr:hypothetical protein [Bacteroidota bacterium]
MAKPAVINIIDAHIPHGQKSDDALIMLFQNGEQEVFRYLVERYREKVRNIIFSIFMGFFGGLFPAGRAAFTKITEALRQVG